MHTTRSTKTTMKTLALCGADSRLICTCFATLCDQQTSGKSRDAKTRPNFKNPARSNSDIVLSLRIDSHLPAHIENGGEETVWKWLIFELARSRDLTLDHTAYHHASLIDLYQNAKFQANRKTFCGHMHVRTHACIDGQTSSSLLILLGRPWLSRPNNLHRWQFSVSVA